MARKVLKHEDQPKKLQDAISIVTVSRLRQQQHKIKGLLVGLDVSMPIGLVQVLKGIAPGGPTSALVSVFGGGAIGAAVSHKHPRWDELKVAEYMGLETVQNLVDRNPKWLGGLGENTKLLRIRDKRKTRGQYIHCKGPLVHASNPYWQPERLIVRDWDKLDFAERERMEAVRVKRRSEIERLMNKISAREEKKKKH